MTSNVLGLMMYKAYKALLGGHIHVLIILTSYYRLFWKLSIVLWYSKANLTPWRNSNSNGQCSPYSGCPHPRFLLPRISVQWIRLDSGTFEKKESSNGKHTTESRDTPDSGGTCGGASPVGMRSSKMGVTETLRLRHLWNQVSPETRDQPRAPGNEPTSGWGRPLPGELSQHQVPSLGVASNDEMSTRRFFTYNTVSFDTSWGHVAVFCDKTGVLRLIAKFIRYSQGSFAFMQAVYVHRYCQGLGNFRLNGVDMPECQRIDSCGTIGKTIDALC